jgi:hypothetical protein
MFINNPLRGFHPIGDLLDGAGDVVIRDIQLQPLSKADA